MAGGASIYVCVGGAPLSYVDPHGLLRFHPWVKRQYPNTVNYINATRDRMTATKYEGFSRAADTGRKHLDELLDPCAGPVVTPDRLKHDHGRYTNGSGELFVHRSYFDRFEAGDRSPELLDILNRTIEHELVHFSEYFWNRNRSTIEEGWRYENIVYGTPIPRN
ncbi:hypothetical protein [Stenotrophomonas acidaminiphila]|uniref:hypothetical protein n=1 Tax=Stenotrophomonas acidaminiphila TaxID=128780 RepID=UPI002D7EB9D8|nr:hypothetical protein [Stenotrophomonas acidaminiphila]